MTAHADDTAAESGAGDHTWIVDQHILVTGSSVTEQDAEGFSGRTVELSQRGYMSPWHGTCENASRTLQRRPLPELVHELEIKMADDPVLRTFGFGDDVIEIRLTCNDRPNPPPFLVYVSNGKAMSCSRGACYLMKRF